MAACRLNFDAPADAGGTVGDGSGDIDTAVDPCAAEREPRGAWSPAVRIAELSSTSSDEDPTPTADGLELFMVSSRGGNADIYRSSRVDVSAAWSTPVLVSELAHPSTENTITLSDDALTMWFGSQRPGGLGMDDFWVTTRPDRSSPWTAPVNVLEISSPSVDRGITVYDQERALMFHSDRPGGLGAADLYESTRATTADAWSAPVRLGEPNTTFTEQHPWVSACGLVMTFHSNRLGGTDLFESSRTSVMDAFAMTRALSELNTTNFDKDLRVSPDLRRAMFASDRTGNMDIYETTR